jgi:hypothetical protein
MLYRDLDTNKPKLSGESVPDAGWRPFEANLRSVDLDQDDDQNHGPTRLSQINFTNTEP